MNGVLFLWEDGALCEEFLQMKKGNNSLDGKDNSNQNSQANMIIISAKEAATSEMLVTTNS